MSMGRRSVGRLLFMVLVIASAVSATGSGHRPSQWAIIYLWEPTLIGETIVKGPVIFVHQETTTTHDGPCTTIQLYDPSLGPIQEIAAFRCTPTARPVVSTFTLTTRPNTALNYGCVLTEFQFAGDAEGHGVPESRFAH